MASSGIMTAPQQVDYDDVLRVWQEADAIAEIEHAWLFDHLMPIGGDPLGPACEAWTLLAGLAAQTRRLGLGLLVTSLRVSYDDPERTRQMIADAVGAGFGHIILGLPAPYPVGVVRRIADELIALRATA